MYTIAHILLNLNSIIMSLLKNIGLLYILHNGIIIHNDYPFLAVDMVI